MKGGVQMEKDELNYAHIDEYLFEVMLRDDMFDDIASSDERWQKFDTIIEQVREGTCVSLQKTFDEIFGQGMVVVM
jgi:hypothetical protein